MTIQPITLRRFAGAALVLFLAAVATIGEFARGTQLLHEADTLSPAAQRFAALRRDLPAHGVVCYLSDSDVHQLSNFAWFFAEYNLAPVVLRAGGGCEHAVGDFSNPAAAPAAIASNGYEIEHLYAPGLMLLRRKQP
jgi:hypothetical protein